ncbi:MAG: TIGR04282 family arsenosugar biosynthesis glycosyltransferase [Sediminibacterium sp.]
MNTRALIIFVRTPELGMVKTRLAKTMGDADALAIYQALLQHTRAITVNYSCDKFLFYAGTTNSNDIWDDTCYIKKEQSGNHLGERMLHAFTDLFSKGYKEVLIIGSDCPGLTPALIHTAFEQLATKKIVIGQSMDGGYYLLGMTELISSLFEDKAWSTDRLCEQTIQTINESKLSYSLLPVLADIDTEEDWIQNRHLLDEKY